MTYSKGLHILAEIDTAVIEALTDYAAAKLLLQKIIEKHQLTIVSEVFTNFEGGGFTGVYCLTESHISIHTWPEFGHLSRKEFLELSGIALLGSTLGLQTLTSCESAKGIQGQMVGANHAIGHLLRKAISLPISQTHQTKVLIIGSGISGLTAGYYLQKAGINDYEILELESHIGGNSTFGEDASGRYPWAAHYLPIPSPENKELINFLAENNIITGFDEHNLLIYDEYALCFHPDERLFVKGFWQEGLIPNMDISDEEKNQIGAFLTKMNNFKAAKGKDQKWAFTIPLANSSNDTGFTDLDKISMKTWMEQNAFTVKPLQWYVNYCLLDDYGTPITETSAWAGIHYFASRKGKAANAKDDDVLTWSEGNGFFDETFGQKSVKAYQNPIFGLSD